MNGAGALRARSVLVDGRRDWWLLIRVVDSNDPGRCGGTPVRMVHDGPKRLDSRLDFGSALILSYLLPKHQAKVLGLPNVQMKTHRGKKSEKLNRIEGNVETDVDSFSGIFVDGGRRFFFFLRVILDSGMFFFTALSTCLTYAPLFSLTFRHSDIAICILSKGSRKNSSFASVMPPLPLQTSLHTTVLGRKRWTRSAEESGFQSLAPASKRRLSATPALRGWHWLCCVFDFLPAKWTNCGIL
jgi:hypothetical protein